MKITFTGCLGLLLAAIASGAHGATLAPFVLFSDDSQSMNLDVHFDGTGWALGPAGGGSLDTATSHVSYNGYIDPDPFISYSVGITNSTNVAQTYTFTFFTPLLPNVTGANLVSGSISGGVSDLFGDGVQFAPTATFVQISSVGGPITGMGVDVGGAFSAGLGTPGANYTYGAYSSGIVAGPVGGWSYMQTTLSFTLSPFDAVALTGFTQITPVPEPGPQAMLMAALLLAAGFHFQARIRKK